MENGDRNARGGVQYNHNERMASGDSSLANSDLSSRRGEERIKGVQHLDSESSSYSRGVYNRNPITNYELNVNRSRQERVGFCSEDALMKTGAPIESLRSEEPLQWCVDRKGPERGAPAQGRFNYSLYHEGPSSYETNPYYEQGVKTRYPNHNSDGLDRVESVDNGRAELLARLDELKDQISRSYDVTEKHKGMNGTDQRIASQGPPHPHPRHNAAYLNQAPEVTPYTDGYGLSLIDFYSQRGRGYPHEFVGYADSYQQEMSQKPQSQHMHWPYHEHFHGYYRDDVNHNLFMLHQDEKNSFHHPSCSCVHCRNKNCHLPPEADPNYHHHPNPIQPRPQGYSSGVSNVHTLHSQKPLSLNQNDLESENDGVNHQRTRKMVVAQRSGRLLHPIAGGAPFIACSNCFELLKLPRKHITLAKKQQKMKCGACSSIILLEIRNKGFTISVNAESDYVPTETVDENLRYWHNGANSTADTNDFCDDYDDPEHSFSRAEKRSNFGESEKQFDPISEKQMPESLTYREHDSELNLTETESLPHPDLFSVEWSDQCSDNVMASRFDKGKRSKRSELDQSISRQSSVQNAAATETEMEMSLNEFSNSYVSQDTTVDKGNKEDHPMPPNKGPEPFFAGLNIKKSLRDFMKSKLNVGVDASKVSVNGHRIPDRVVKKAEKLAGPIQPGEYWYDSRAGFWGVMGHPCLGIIMPNIEEFNYPMPEKCAGGNTGVFVNGRELNHRDLNLLVSRGLPNIRHGSYLVEISGNVVDEHTGEELGGLGRLARTVEKAKHGFGMKVPGFIARLQS